MARIWRFRGLIGSTFSTFLAIIFHWFSMIAFVRKRMENVEPVTPRKRQTRATAIFSYLRRRLGAILGGFWDSKTRPRRPKMAPRWAKMAPRWAKMAKLASRLHEKPTFWTIKFSMHNLLPLVRFGDFWWLLVTFGLARVWESTSLTRWSQDDAR